MPQPSGHSYGVPGSVGLSEADEIGGKLGFDRIESFERLDDPNDPAADPGIDKDLQDGVERAALFLGDQLLVDLFGERNDVFADLRSVGAHVHRDFSEA